MRYLTSPLILLLALAGCDYDATGSSTAGLGTPTDRCAIAGSGRLPGGELLDGSAHGGEGGTTGAWTHIAGDLVTVGAAEWIVCRINGVLLGDLGGPATYNGEAGYQFLVSVQDFGASGEEHLGTTEIQTVSATRYYRPSRWEDGEVQITDHALVTIPSELPVTVGNAGNQWAWVTFERADTLDIVTCRYRGSCSGSHPRSGDSGLAGTTYEFVRCTGEADGSEQVDAGDRVDVNWMTVQVHTGAHSLPSFDAAQTTVTVDLEVTQTLPAQGDFYHFAVGDAAGQMVYETQGYLESGDITVQQLQ